MPGACGTRLYIDFSVLEDNAYPTIVGLDDIESFSDHGTHNNRRYFNFDLYCRASYNAAGVPHVDASVRAADACAG